MFLFDLATLDGLVRVAAFLVVGILLLLAGTRYARAFAKPVPQNRIQQREVVDTRRGGCATCSPPTPATSKSESGTAAPTCARRNRAEPRQRRKLPPRNVLLAIPTPQQLIHADRPPVRAMVPTFVGLSDATTVGPQLGHPVLDAAAVLLRRIVIRSAGPLRYRVMGRMVRCRDRRRRRGWRR